MVYLFAIVFASTWIVLALLGGCTFYQPLGRIDVPTLSPHKMEKKWPYDFSIQSINKYLKYLKANRKQQ